MPEYRRFIAYFYEYIDGKKQKNAGFAKVELRNGMWRILFRVTASSQPEPPVQVYGFVREKGYLLGLLMGTMRPGREMMEEWGYKAELPVWRGTYRLEDLSGIWIQSGDDRSYITVWDDEPVDAERFVLELPESEKEPGEKAVWTDGNPAEQKEAGSRERNVEYDGGTEAEEWKGGSPGERSDGSGTNSSVEMTAMAGEAVSERRDAGSEIFAAGNNTTDQKCGDGLESDAMAGGEGRSATVSDTTDQQYSGSPEMGMIVSGGAEGQEDGQFSNNKMVERIDQVSLPDPGDEMIVEECVEEEQEKEKRREKEREQEKGSGREKESGQEKESRQEKESGQEIKSIQEKEIRQEREKGQGAEKGREIGEKNEMGSGQESAQGQVSMRECAPGQRRRPIQNQSSAQRRIPSKEQLWQELSRARTHFQPFEDTEFTKCIQIMPCDVMRLQQAGVQVGRSNFLLHGFYQYRHLLLGITQEGDWIIGVPGVQNNQERYMAQMFGFNQFKTARRPDRNRQFGYWCRSLGSVPEEIDEGTKAEDQQEQAQEQKQE